MNDVARRQTWQKEAVRDALAGCPDFIAAQQLHSQLRGEGSTIGLATVYRNLNEMVRNNEADTLHTSNGEQLYRLCGQEHHHHLICRDCGKTVEIDAPLESWVDSVAAQHGFSDVRHIVDIFGVCPDCQRKVSS